MSRHEEFAARPESEPVFNDDRQSDGPSYPLTLFGGSNQAHEVRHGLGSNGGGPVSSDVWVGDEYRSEPFIEPGTDPGTRLGRTARPRRTRDWRGG